jgi:hypothetical protein
MERSTVIRLNSAATNPALASNIATARTSKSHAVVTIASGRAAES